MGVVEVKQKLFIALNNRLAPIRKKREGLSDEEVLSILKRGCEKAREAASKTMASVKKCLHQMV